ncbi:hypothetical protein B0G81_5021 [Paraburkholderia sp. BL6665CI2N2]|nr:hypothetical protein B0G81_5021 [Paraburkholderia sp. BL6665CI2N2]
MIRKMLNASQLQQEVNRMQLPVCSWTYASHPPEIPQSAASW